MLTKKQNIINLGKQQCARMEIKQKLTKYSNYFVSWKNVLPDDARHVRVACFQGAMKVTIVSGQVFALMPVLGVTSENTADVRFELTNWKSLYSLTVIVGQLYMTVMAFNALNIDSSFKTSPNIVFYGTTLITLVLFYKMASSWPALAQRATRIEKLDMNCDVNLVSRSKIISYVFLFMALSEHVLSLLAGFERNKSCDPPLPLNSYEDFVNQFYPWIFAYIPYSVVAGMITQYLHVQSTFAWNFSDLFVISVSLYLISRLQQVNKKLEDTKGKNHPEAFWRGLREEYVRAAQLVRKVDDVVGGVIFISFANNLFFVCLQLFNSLQSGFKARLDCGHGSSVSGYVTSSYYIFSLVCLIVRSVAVSLISAQVHAVSTRPARMLYEVPSVCYYTEVQRFLDQVHCDKVALTGLNFFSITRGLLLSVAATIVTYELVMVQFNAPQVATEMPPFNVTT